AIFNSRGKYSAHPEGVRSMRSRSLLVAFICLALVAPLAVAQTTGEISGVVRGSDGAPLPGATVTITGPPMHSGPSTTTLAAGTFQLAPGVAENNASTGSPNAGGGRQDNTYLYDGVNITNPFFGDLFQNFSELDIQEVAITRGGVTAEYGRTGGFIVNGVTKS